MSWTFEPAARGLASHREQWDSLNARRGNHILLDSVFVEPLLKHFGTDSLLLGVQDSAEPGMVLLERISSGVWQTFQPSQSPLGLILFAVTDDKSDALRELLRALPGYALQFSVLQQDPDYTSFPSVQSRAELDPLDYIRTARITIKGSFEEYWKARGSNLRHNLSRRRRRLLEKGHTPELLTLRAPEEVAAAIREYGRMETKGWKAGGGTAISDDNAQGRFYREVLESLCARGEGVIYQLRAGGQIIASDLCVMRNGMMVTLKTTYDEDWNDYSPAFLMREEILKQVCVEQKIRVIEFYGRAMEWHTKWSEEIRTMYHLTCYRNLWVKRLKAMTKRFR